MDKASRSTTLVIPCFNEAGNAEHLVTRAKFAIEESPSLDIVFVDNGSTDSTFELINALIENIERLSLCRVEKNIGYGNGIKHGLKFAQGAVVGWTHADLQTDPFDAVRAIANYPKEDVRFLIKGARSGRPLSDKLFTFGMSLFETVLFRQKLWDINAQPTLFSRELLPIIQEGPDDFSLDLFALIAARKNGFAELRFPVHFGPRFSGESKWNTSQSARLRFIKRTIDFSLKLAKRRWSNADNSTPGK